MPYDRGDHYLSNLGGASSGDGVAFDNYELAGGRPRPDGGPRPASPPLSSIPRQQPTRTVTRLPGSVQVNKPVTTARRRPLPQSSIGQTPSSTASPSAHSSKHRVYLALQRDKLLMGGERELSQINITITVLLGLIALMTLNWHLAIVALLFGGPVQSAIRILSEHDPDYVKTYIEGLTCPHLRKPEEPN